MTKALNLDPRLDSCYCKSKLTLAKRASALIPHVIPRVESIVGILRTLVLGVMEKAQLLNIVKRILRLILRVDYEIRFKF